MAVSSKMKMEAEFLVRLACIALYLSSKDYYRDICKRVLYSLDNLVSAL